MQRKCEDCGARYDDATCTTICPHGQFISDENARQKDLAFSLVGKPLRFAHQGPDDPWLFIQTINQDGMVTLREGYEGEFAPHLFVVANSLYSQQQIALTQAQIDKFQAQALLLQQSLGGLTEFRQWVSIQQQLAQAQQELQRLNAPEKKSTEEKSK